jgi:ABC-type transport system involved in multi-copper enzyme maturation permease subunit
MGEQNTQDAMRTVRREGLPIFDANIELGTIFYIIMQPLKGLLWLLILIAGAGAISSDRRYNAFPLYFSRPLKPWHYTVGKILGIAVIPLAAMLLCQWIIGLQFIAYYLTPSALITELPSFLMAALYATILCGFISAIMASISSMAKSARVAGVAFLCFFVLLEKVIPLLASSSGQSALLSLSPLHSMDVIGRALLRPDLGNIKSSVETGALSLTASVVAIIAYLVIFLSLLRKNLRVVEMVK